MQSYATKWRLPASIPTTEAGPSSSTSPLKLPPLQPIPAASGITPIRPGLENLPSCSAISSPSQSMPSDKTGVYISLHNYSPQRPDELELKKGSQYIVKEVCQDGWFKGVSAENLFQNGFFPSNYVMPLVYHQKMLSMQKSSLQAQKNNSNTRSLTGAYTNMSFPPELPQRNIRSTQTPLTQLNKADANSPISQTQKTDENVNKQKKESVTGMLSKQLMKKLGYRKPNEISAYSMDNPVFEDSLPSATNGNNHARSRSFESNFSPTDSCPPTVFPSAAGVENCMQFGSQRIKVRERTSLPSST